jgi:hypothetical protein
MSSRVLVCSVFLAYLLSACGGDGPCGEIYDKQKACWEKEAEDEDDKRKIPSRDMFVAACKIAEKENKKEVETMAACSKKGTCEEMEECMRAASRAEYAKEQVEEVNKQIKEGKWKDAFDNCRYASDSFKDTPDLASACEKVFTEGMPKLLEGEHAEDVSSACRYSEELKAASPTFATACGGVAKATLEQKTKAAIAARDGAVDDFAICYDLQSAAEAVSPEEKAKADALCAEITIATNAKKGIEEAKAAIAAQSTDISYYCRSAAEELVKMTTKSEWATKVNDEVLRTCFIAHGTVIIDKELPGKYCSWPLTQLREFSATYKLAELDPAFGTKLATTDKICKQ